MDLKEINRIKKQFNSGRFPKFLKSITIDGLRGLNNVKIEFKFPIVAIVGENGTGKSTFLKAAACAYINEDEKIPVYFPSKLFLDTYWDTITNVALSYAVTEGDHEHDFKITKSTKRWSFPEKPKRKRRNVYFFDITRTIPKDATVGYAKIAKQAASEKASAELDKDYKKQFSYILAKEYTRARFVTYGTEKKRDVGLLTKQIPIKLKVAKNGQIELLFDTENLPKEEIELEISQFHQGAGEASTLDLMQSLQGIPNTSLVIIDEVEASLHPKAQRRLVRFFLWLCRKKNVQIILSTHSPYVLEELPEEARIFLLATKTGIEVFYGITPEFALSRIDDIPHPELYIYVEDRESEILLREVLSKYSEPQILSRVSIVPIGKAYEVRLLGSLAKDGKLPFKSISIEDGDQTDSDDCLRLPGNKSPEETVFERLKGKNWPNLDDRFGIGSGDLFTYFEDAMSNPDHHKWLSYIGDHIRKSRIIVWEILCHEWCRECLEEEEVNGIIQAINERLDTV